MSKIIKIRDIKYFVSNEDDLICKEMKRKGDIWEGDFLRKLKKYIYNGSCVIDAGAHVGNHSMFFSKYAKKVFAFEPSPENYEILQRNIKLNNLSNILSLPIALSNKKAKYSIDTTNKDMANNSGKTYLIEDSNGSIVGDCLDNILYQNSYFEGKDNISLIKYDIEEMEYEALCGSMEIIKKFKPILFIEFLPSWERRRKKDYSAQIRKNLEKIQYSLIRHDGRNETWGYKKSIQVVETKELTGTELFKICAIETQTKCNRSCEFCYNNKSLPKREQGRMEDKTWKEIIDQLSNMGFMGRVALQGWNEPLLDDRLFDIIKYCRERCPCSCISINTNGDFLTKSLFKELIKSGLSLAIITNYDENKEKKVLDLLSKKYPGNIIYQSLEVFSKQKYDRPIGKKINYNITGKKCCSVGEKLIINWKGDIVLCCEDFYGEQCFGNAREELIYKIWMKQKFVKIRKDLVTKGNRRDFKLCKYCNRSI